MAMRVMENCKNKYTDKVDLEKEDFVEEKDNLESIQDVLDENIKIQKKYETRARRSIEEAEKIDPHEKWTQVSTAHEKLEETKRQIQRFKQLKDEPYVGRFDLTIKCGSSKPLSKVVYIGKQYYNWDDKTIINWADDSDERKKEILRSYYGNSICDFSAGNNKYSIDLKRKIKIIKGKLKVVTTEYSRNGYVTEHSVTDTFLLQVLKYRREKGGLSDIIATIQAKQNEIIRQPVEKSFIVQGCAGSGKTQILLHRLAYIKQGKKEINWRRTRIITPGEVFQMQVQPLVTSLHIDEVPKLSLEELYLQILKQFTPLFSKGSFIIKKESNLSIEYLNDIYSRKQTIYIRGVIDSYINALIAECEDMSFVADEIKKDSEYISLSRSKRISKLHFIISKCIAEDTSELYMETLNKCKKEKEILQKMGVNLSQLNLRQMQINTELERLLQYDKEKEEDYKMAFMEVDKKINKEIEEFNERKLIATNKSNRLNDNLKNVQKMNHTERMKFFKEQISLEEAVLSYETSGQNFRRHEEILRKMKEEKEILVEMFKADFYTTKKTPKEYEIECSSNAQLLIVEKGEIRKKIKEYSTHLINIENLEKNIQHMDSSNITSDEMKKAKEVNHILDNLITNIYNKIIRPNTDELKTKYSICKSIKQKNKNKKIIYRRDLYFLLYTCFAVFGNLSNNQKEWFFIDEGQNISVYDYQLMFDLYPKGNFNILGDTKQCINHNCGIKNWEALHKDFSIFELNENYRNTEQVVKFTNERLGTNMVPLGLSDGWVNSVSDKGFLNFIRRALKSKFRLAVIVNKSKEFQELLEDHPPLSNLLSLITDENILCKENYIPVYTIDSVKGMEFEKTIVFPKNMNNNAKYIAYTRALKEMYILE